MSTINSRLRVVGIGVAALFVALFAQLNYLQVFHASTLDHNPLNTRDVVEEYEQPRGAIISADGLTLAQSVPSRDQYKYQRQYPQGPLFAQITGYFSFTYGTDGLERQYNSVLTKSSTPVRLPTNIAQIKTVLH